jgi:hypothetical protein
VVIEHRDDARMYNGGVPASKLACATVVAVLVGLVALPTALADGFGEGQSGRGGQQPGTPPTGGTQQQPSGRPAVASAQTRSGGSDASDGVVQSVSQHSLVLRQLDGSTVTISISGQTTIYVNGAPGRIGDVRAGYVVVGDSSQGKSPGALYVVRSG